MTATFPEMHLTKEEIALGKLGSFGHLWAGKGWTSLPSKI
jgi:hypothetical protein